MRLYLQTRSPDTIATAIRAIPPTIDRHTPAAKGARSSGPEAATVPVSPKSDAAKATANTARLLSGTTASYAQRLTGRAASSDDVSVVDANVDGLMHGDVFLAAQPELLTQCLQPVEVIALN